MSDDALWGYCEACGYCLRYTTPLGGASSDGVQHEVCGVQCALAVDHDHGEAIEWREVER